MLQRWLKDHPGEKTVPERIKGNLANIKSVLRKKKRKKPGRKPGVAAAPTDGAVVAVAIEPARISTKGFEHLEEARCQLRTKVAENCPAGAGSGKQVHLQQIHLPK